MLKVILVKLKLYFIVSFYILILYYFIKSKDHQAFYVESFT